MKHFKAIAAMSENRVIGQGNRIPWHLPEDFKWFKKMTVGNVVVMGRRTFESIGKPLPTYTVVILDEKRLVFRAKVLTPFHLASLPLQKKNCWIRS